MSLIKLPIELRLRIYDFCFPPPDTNVQVVPYIASSSSCHLNLPLHLYLVCKTIYTELPLLKSKLHQLDFTFLAAPTPSTEAEDNALARTLQYAERLRVVVTEWPRQPFPPKKLFPGSDCAVKVVELQPVNCDVKGKLEIILIREESTLDNEETVDEIESFLFKLNQQLNALDS